MLIIEGMTAIKRLGRKVDDLIEKIAKHSSDTDIQDPVYVDQKAKVSGWLESVRICVRNMNLLRQAICRTNLETEGTITVAGKKITNTIAYWVTRRTGDSIAHELKALRALSDRNNLQEGQVTLRSGDVLTCRVRRYFDPDERDQKMSELSEELSAIDAMLQVTNATTNLIGLPDGWSPDTEEV